MSAQQENEKLVEAIVDEYNAELSSKKKRLQKVMIANVATKLFVSPKFVRFVL